MKVPLYVITGRNRMTGERVVISQPGTKAVIQDLLNQAKSRQNSHSVYSRLTMRLAVEQSLIKFESYNQ